MSNMNRREESIIEAAFTLFARFGVKRTSMNDIAAEAGIARQTLYNAFSSKDEVLQATIRLFADRASADIGSELERATNLGEQLDVVFRHVSLRPFDQLRDTPNTEDVIAGFNAAGEKEIEAADERFRKIIERILAPHEQAILDNGLSLKQLSDFIQRSASAAKHSARNRKHLLALLDALRISAQKLAGAE